MLGFQKYLRKYNTFSMVMFGEEEDIGITQES